MAKMNEFSVNIDLGHADHSFNSAVDVVLATPMTEKQVRELTKRLAGVVGDFLRTSIPTATITDYANGG
jgi:hypothetical protein